MARGAHGAAASPASDQTRDRLLRAAGEAFVRAGFRRATVREIVRRAGANVAAVNYHFGGKQGLYAEVLRHGVSVGLERYPIDMGLPPNPMPEQRLLAFVRSFLFRVIGPGEHAWSGRLMLWEMVEPTGALDGLFKDVIRPLYAQLESIVRDLTGESATPQLVRLGCASILGQCSFYKNAEALLAKIQPAMAGPLEARQIEAIAEHVTRFSVAGLRGYASGVALTGPRAGAKAGEP